MLVATPGRLMHHLEEVAALSLRTAEYVVFDEADRRALAQKFESLCFTLSLSRAHATISAAC